MKFLLKNIYISFIFFCSFFCLILIEQLYSFSVNFLFIDYVVLLFVIFVYYDVSLFGICFIIGIVKDIITLNPIIGLASIEYILFYFCISLAMRFSIEKWIFYIIVGLSILVIKIIVSIFYSKFSSMLLI